MLNTERSWSYQNILNESLHPRVRYGSNPRLEHQVGLTRSSPLATAPTPAAPRDIYKVCGPDYCEIFGCNYLYKVELRHNAWSYAAPPPATRSSTSHRTTEKLDRTDLSIPLDLV